MLFVIGEIMPGDEPIMLSVNRTERIKNGNKEGIKTRKQSETPSDAPFIAVFGSNIKRRMPIEQKMLICIL